MTGWQKHTWFLRSRKVQVALATIVAALAAQYGLELSETTLVAVITTGAAVILGIAVEDAGAKAATDRRSVPQTQLTQTPPPDQNLN